VLINSNIIAKLALCLAFSTSPLLCAQALAGVATDWHKTALKLTGESKWPSPKRQRALAILDVAMFDAANAVKGYYVPYTYDITAPASTASEEAAASQAAFNIMIELMPEKKSDFQALNDKFLSGQTDALARDAGIALGNSVATAVLASRAGDGSDFGSEYAVRPAGLGVYQPTSDGPMIGPKLSLMKPFALTSADQFDVPSPPATDSAQFFRDFMEVSQEGGTREQTNKDKIAVAQFHGSSALVPWNQITYDQITACKLSLVDEARALAMLNVTMMDAMVAGFKAKYEYNFWRPTTAIHAGGEAFGHPEAKPDPAWTAVLPVPLHPEYPCQHCATGSAAQIALESIFGAHPNGFSVADSSGIKRDYVSFRQYADEVSESRVIAGAHFRWSTIVGSALGNQIGKFVSANKMSPREPNGSVAKMSASSGGNCPVAH
jgi:PAP2 superfamily